MPGEKKGEEFSINLDDPVPLPTDEWVSILFQLDVSNTRKKISRRNSFLSFSRYFITLAVFFYP
jgi:hypothetical protein